MEWHFSFPLVNSFNKTETAIFLMQIMLPCEFAFFLDKCYLLQLVFSACVAAVKCRPVPHYCVVIFFLVLRNHGLYIVFFSIYFAYICTYNSENTHSIVTNKVEKLYVKPKMCFTNISS